MEPHPGEVGGEPDGEDQQRDDGHDPGDGVADAPGGPDRDGEVDQPDGGPEPADPRRAERTRVVPADPATGRRGRRRHGGRCDAHGSSVTPDQTRAVSRRNRQIAPAANSAVQTTTFRIAPANAPVSSSAARASTPTP